ncbi:bifunctional metallophosphatase/5'-nucleotidase [Microbulbifer epialgicus]|uniref:Bifunctional UDP-sugar hydrolase/5'-nucleotidase n=1 Tax=Microbulbifer epialgicus TaxID=393907 RepID=A0ABV4NUW0_9GAMM
MTIKKYLLAAFACCGLLTGCKSDEPMSIKITHVNDTHSYFDEEAMQLELPDATGKPVATYAYVGGYPRLKTKIDELRNEALVEEKDFMLLHAGDAFAGTLFFTLFKGTLNAEFMNYFEFDAMVIGNHEFDLGNESLASFSKSVNFPLLSSNIKTKKRDPLHDEYLPFTVKLYDGKPVAIVGITTEYTEIISSPSDATKFLTAEKAAKKTVKALKSSGINKIIFLTHSGLESDIALAASVPGIDVIIGGHSPEVLGDHSNIGLGDQGPSPIMMTGPKGDPVCIMHSGEKAKAIGITDVEFSGGGVVESCSGQNVFLVGNVFAQGSPAELVDDDTYQNIYSFISSSNNIEIVEKDLTSQAMLEQAKAEVDAFTSTVVGIASEPLYHVRLPGDEHEDAGELVGGSMVGPHVALSMAEKMEQTSGQPYVAMMNAGGVRADLVGEITVGSAYSVMPFSSTVVSMSVTGESLVNTLSTNVANSYLISSVAFPYVANIHYTINLTDPESPKVENVLVKDENGVFQEIDLSARYYLATTSYLAGGGDLYSFDEAQDITDTGHVDADVLVQYVEGQTGGFVTNIDSGITIIK